MASRPVLTVPEIPAVIRLSRLAPLGPDDLAIVVAAAAGARSVAPRQDLTAAWRAAAPVLILDGWAHRSALLADGRRQISEILLPGDVVVNDPIAEGRHLAVSTTTALTYCSLPSDRIAEQPALTTALKVARSLEQRLLRRQILRLGRMGALERVVDWLLELYERLGACGLASDGEMPLPLTQEIMADALGLTNVHVSRTMTLLRRDNLIIVQGGRATFLDPLRCRAIVER